MLQLSKSIQPLIHIEPGQKESISFAETSHTFQPSTYGKVSKSKWIFITLQIDMIYLVTKIYVKLSMS